mmetsp:Transcript_26096/g.43104  ORF Transcript_26096/g.43104 Transcript_26096/m.43104 type:complete len:222 (+) Transcript_26096:559-1224(+)
MKSCPSRSALRMVAWISVRRGNGASKVACCKARGASLTPPHRAAMGSTGLKCLNANCAIARTWRRRSPEQTASSTVLPPSMRAALDCPSASTTSTVPPRPWGQICLSSGCLALGVNGTTSRQHAARAPPARRPTRMVCESCWRSSSVSLHADRGSRNSQAAAQPMRYQDRCGLSQRRSCLRLPARHLPTMTQTLLSARPSCRRLSLVIVSGWPRRLRERVA